MKSEIRSWGTGNPYRQFWLWALGIGAAVFLLIAVETLLFWLNHAELFGGVPAYFQKRILIFVTILAITAAGTFLVVLWYFFQTYVVPLRRLEEDVDALVVGSPEARARAGGAERVSPLVSALNRLMERYEPSEEVFEKRIADETGSLRSENEQLESILDALSEGVIVCDAGGVVVRYNRTVPGLLETTEDLGLGRSVYEIVEKQLCDYALETLGEQMMAGVVNPFVQFGAERAGKDPLRMRVVPLTRGQSSIAGFVLTLEEDVHSLSSTGLSPVSHPPFHLDPEHALLEELRFVVFDTETTGMNPSRGDEIVSIAGVVVARNRVVTEEAFERLVNPGVPISAASTRIHGLTAADLAGQPRLAEVLGAFARFAEGAVLVAHNAAFDMRFLNQKERETGIAFRQPVLDTLLLSAVLHPTQTSHSLDTLLERYGIRPVGRHTALGDARMTAELLLGLLPQLAARGITTLAQAIRASRRTPLARVKY